MLRPILVLLSAVNLKIAMQNLMGKVLAAMSGKQILSQLMKKVPTLTVHLHRTGNFSPEHLCKKVANGLLACQHLTLKRETLASAMD